MYKIFSHLPTGIYQWEDVSNGSDDWAGRKYELPSGYRIHHYAVEIIITFCVNLLRFALSFYVLGNVTFCGPTQRSFVPLAKRSFGTIPVFRHSVDHSPMVAHSYTHNVVRPSCVEVLC